MMALDGWENFYVIVGSSAGALIGLQFVVLTLIAERPPLRAPEVAAAFATPSVVHFAVVLLLSAIVSAPWNGIGTCLLNAGRISIPGPLQCAASAVRRGSRDLATPLCWHSQCLGRHHLSRFRKSRGKGEV
jgi:hypothetical protein